MLKQMMSRRRMKRRLYINNGSLWSNGCYFSAEECVDAEWEPGVMGLWCEWLQWNSFGFYSRISGWQRLLLTVIFLWFAACTRLWQLSLWSDVIVALNSRLHVCSDWGHVFKDQIFMKVTQIWFKKRSDSMWFHTVINCHIWSINLNLNTQSQFSLKQNRLMLILREINTNSEKMECELGLGEGLCNNN